MKIASSAAPTDAVMLLAKRSRNSWRAVETSPMRSGERPSERHPPPVRLEVEPGDQMALRDVDRRLERRRERPVDGKQRDQRPQREQGVDHGAAGGALPHVNLRITRLASASRPVTNTIMITR